MKNTLRKIQDDYTKLCNTEYIFYLENKEVINLQFKMETYHI